MAESLAPRLRLFRAIRSREGFYKALEASPQYSLSAKRANLVRDQAHPTEHLSIEADSLSMTYRIEPTLLSRSLSQNRRDERRMRRTVNLRSLRNIVRTMFDVFQMTALMYKVPSSELSVFLCSDATIRKLNCFSRNKNTATDVISIQYSEPTVWQGKPNLEADDTLYGDIVISLDTAYRQSKRFGISIEEECKILATHGLLHLFGYDDQRNKDRYVMKKAEEQILLRYQLQGERRHQQTTQDSYNQRSGRTSTLLSR